MAVVINLKLVKDLERVARELREEAHNLYGVGIDATTISLILEAANGLDRIADMERRGSNNSDYATVGHTT